MNSIYIDRDWFKIWTKKHYPQLMQDSVSTIVSMYSPYFLDNSEGDNNGPYTAALTLGLFKDSNDKTNLIFYSMFPRALLDPNQLIIHAGNLCRNYFNNTTDKNYDGSSPDLFLVPSEDDVRNSIFTDIRDKSNEVPVKRFFYNKYGKTLDNLLKRALPKIIQGRIWVAAKPGSKVEIRNMDEKFLMILSGYPSPEATATVWALCQAILFLESGGLFSEYIVKNTEIKPKNCFY